MQTGNSNNGKSKIKLLYFNKFWHHEYPDFSQLNIPDFEIYTDKSFKYWALTGTPDIDVVIFHIPNLELKNEELMRLKKAGQIWVYWTIECSDHFPRFKDPEVLKLFDITSTYSYDSNIPLPYISAQPDLWRKEPVQKSEFANAFFSSEWDKSGRYELLQRIMKHVDIHSYGKVCNNRTLDKQDPYKISGMNAESVAFKNEVMSKYKFTLAFENAIAKDYVTEKFFQPLQAGSVPVYLGAPNIEEFAPGENCYINVNSFSSVKELAEYLVYLDGNDEAYNKYLKWKTDPFRPAFQSKLNYVPNPLESLRALIQK